MHAYSDLPNICTTKIIKGWRRNDYGEMVLGAKRLWCGGITTKAENRGETTWGNDLGGNGLGAKSLVILPTWVKKIIVTLCNKLV